MLHGTSEEASKEICQNGPSTTESTDDGYYGQGMYLSDSLVYSSKYSKPSPQGHVFMICYTLPGNVYPVTEPPRIKVMESEIPNPDGFLGKPHMKGYQSHFTLGLAICCCFLFVCSFSHAFLNCISEQE